MKQTSLVDLFELYDQAYDQVCEQMAIKKSPSWKHRWFYRYLLINPITSFHHKIKKNKVEKVEKGIEGNKFLNELYNLKLEYSLSVLVAHKLDPSFYKSFPDWYFNMIQSDENYAIHKVSRIDFNRQGAKWINYSDKEKEFQDWQKSNVEQIYELYQNSLLGHDVYSIPRVGDKFKIMRNMKKTLDINHRPSFNITENKLREITVKDCFRLLEYKAFNPKATLLKMAVDTNVLRISLAGIDGEYGVNSVNSVKAGVNRLNDLALEILKDSSYSYFPLKGKYIENDEEAVQLVFNNYFNTKPHLQMQKIKNSLPTTFSNMLIKVKDEFKKLDKKLLN